MSMKVHRQELNNCGNGLKTVGLMLLQMSVQDCMKVCQGESKLYWLPRIGEHHIEYDCEMYKQN